MHRFAQEHHRYNIRSGANTQCSNRIDHPLSIGLDNCVVRCPSAPRFSMTASMGTCDDKSLQQVVTMKNLEIKEGHFSGVFIDKNAKGAIENCQFNNNPEYGLRAGPNNPLDGTSKRHFQSLAARPRSAQ
jgi:hypothetical protein